MRVIARLNIGGPAIHVHLLTEGLDEYGFRSRLVTGRISPDEGDMGYLFESASVKPIVIPELQREIRPLLDLKAFWKLLRILWRERPDIVHTHTAKAGTLGRAAAILCSLLRFSRKIRIVHTFHGNVFEGYFRPLMSSLFILIERFLAWKTDFIIAISETQKQELCRKYRIAPPEKVRTIGLGFDLGPFLGVSKWKGRFRKDLGLDGEPLLVGIVGRLVPIKNHRMFIDAAGLFLEQNPGLSVVFVVVGDGELRRELEAYCREKGLEGHVRFCGWIKDLGPVYADLDVLVLTSDNEGTPVSIIEAMAASVPVAATDAGGVRDLLLGKERGAPLKGNFLIGERGVLCRKNDARGLTEGLKYLLNLKDPEKGRLLESSRRFAVDTYGRERLLGDIASLYRTLAFQAPFLKATEFLE